MYNLLLTPLVVLPCFFLAAPNQSDTVLVEALDSVLSHKQKVFSVMEEYSGVEAEMRAAIQTPSEETEVTAFFRLLQNVDSISIIYNYSLALEQVLPPALDSLSHAAKLHAGKRGAALEASLSTKASVSRRLVELFGFVLSFDTMRMMRPLVTNDFSYYRRLLPKYQSHARTAALVKVQSDDTYTMSKFTALTNPMLEAVISAAKAATANTALPLAALPSFGGNGTNAGPGIGGGSSVSEVLAVVANSCFAWLKTAAADAKKAGGRLEGDERAREVARAMIVAACVYDHVSDMGLFSRKTLVRIKEIIAFAQKEFAGDKILLTTLKFATKNYNIAPSDIVRLLEDV
jgi:hypothetical protein